MARELKVYGWSGVRHDDRNTSRHAQTRECMAASSVAEVVRASGIRRHRLVHDLSTTKDVREVEVAMSDPGVVFWSPADRRHREDRPFYRLEGGGS